LLDLVGNEAHLLHAMAAGIEVVTDVRIRGPEQPP
jgi:hypothetical protein